MKVVTVVVMADIINVFRHLNGFVKALPMNGHVISVTSNRTRQIPIAKPSLSGRYITTIDDCSTTNDADIAPSCTARRISSLTVVRVKAHTIVKARKKKEAIKSMILYPGRSLKGAHRRPEISAVMRYIETM